MNAPIQSGMGILPMFGDWSEKDRAAASRELTGGTPVPPR